MKNKKYKFKYIFAVIAFVFLSFLIHLALRSDNKYDIIKRHFSGNIPKSIKKIKREGAASFAGANELIWFDIASSDLEQLLNNNTNFALSDGSLLMNGENIIIGNNGKKESLNNLEFLKFQAKKRGIIPDKIYLTKNASFSNYRILIVGNNKKKVLLKYVK